MEYIKQYDKSLYENLLILIKKRNKKNKMFWRKLLINFRKIKMQNISEIDKNLILQYALDYAQISKDEFDKHVQESLEELNEQKRYNNQDETNHFWNKINNKWLCLNIYVQLNFYNEIYSYICEKFKNKKISVCDYGCGSAALAFAINKKINLKKLHLYDIDNYISNFIKNTIACYKFENTVWYDILEENNEKYDLIICNDVLEHLENATEIIIKLYNKLNKDGYLSLRIAFEVEDSTHLPQASEDFFVINKGYEFLQNNFKLIYEYDKGQGLIINGVYQKIHK